MKLMRWSASVMLGFFLLWGLGGCRHDPHSDKPTGGLVVKVTYGGEPVTEGYVSLTNSATGLGGGGEIGADGTARLEGIAVGEYVVTVSPPVVTNDPNPDQSKYSKLPQKFRSDTTSPLKATIDEGTRDELVIDLKE